MPDPTLPVLVAQLGQRFRLRGYSLRLGALRRAIAAGQIEAERLGGRWLVTEVAARPFAVPLDPAER